MQLFRLALVFLILLNGPLYAQLPDSTQAPETNAVADSQQRQQQVPLPPARPVNPWDQVVSGNKQLNTQKTPEFRIETPRKYESRDAAFYILALLMLMLGFLKLAYSRYFNNLQRVFFNTSLRQSQLTDQLLQAKLPSMLFNLFFVCIAGYYVFLLIVINNKTSFSEWPVVFPLCILSVLVIYLTKYWVLKFAGWITGYRSQTETYIFIVFLINKMIALILVPLVIIMSFAQSSLVNIALIASYVIIGTMIGMRFFRSYGLLQHGLKVSRFHFFLYIIGIEVLPLLLIYQSAMIFIGKNL